MNDIYFGELHRHNSVIKYYFKIESNLPMIFMTVLLFRHLFFSDIRTTIFLISEKIKKILLSYPYSII